MRLMLVFYALLFSSVKAYGCSCVEDMDFQAMEQGASYVVEAEVLKNRWFYSLFKNKYILRPIVVYKGNSRSSIAVWSNKNTSSCGMDFEIGKVYMVFIYEHEGRFTTNICSSWEKDGYRRFQTEAFEEYNANKSLKSDAACGAL
ncbi:hypothetical protein [Marinimicrobium agarilyticum]|uniref:hypothetical protein n=1 Tax=Marinimicrobium agarilyticum TaxID=306546 RepID=UPI00048151B3|nr:hypothetical protein [Marinimicrobium agarilyticum]